MAHVKVWRDEEGRCRLSLNGLDLTYEVYGDGVRVTSTGSGEFDTVCVELKVALGRLDIGDQENVDAALLVGGSLVRMAPEIGVAPR